MELLAGAGLLVLLILGAAIWMFGVAHPPFNHRHAGVAILVMLVPGLAIAYVLLHRCPDRASASAS
jgi:Na+/citrate or Na+/malate symporter